MSPDGREDRLAALRDAVDRIEGGARGGAADAGRIALGAAGAGGSAGSLPLDRLLGGGLRRGALIEVVAAEARDAGAASGFALALAARFAARKGSGSGRPVVWVLEDGAQGEGGMPYAPGLAAHGLDVGRLVVVRASTAAESLWATEEALRCRGLAAVVLDLWRCRLYDLVASRRLVLAAGGSGTAGIVLAAGIPGAAATLSTAAEARFVVAAAPGAAVVPAAQRGMQAGPSALPLPGRASWSVRLARIRAGPAQAGHDCDTFHPLVWDHEEAWFRDAHPVAAPAHPRHRSHPAAGAARAS